MECGCVGEAHGALWEQTGGMFLQGNLGRLCVGFLMEPMKGL